MARKTLIKQSPPSDRLDGYVPQRLQDSDDSSMLSRATLDGYENLVTGVGDYTRDKTFGGQRSGPAFVPRFLTGTMCEDRWRGSDLGGRVVETLADEMTREWVDITIQPDDADPEMDKDARPDSPEKRAARGDFAPGGEGAPAAPAHVPGMLPDIDDESARIIEALEREQRALGAKHAVREALAYERAFGGGAVFLGVDDGEQDLTKPLDLDRVRCIKHLTAYSGGWDGELIAWRYYNDPRLPNFGEPQIYQLRNLGVPIAMPPAPGETSYVAQAPPAGPTGALTFYVHESRLLLFPGTAVSRRARVQMRGWGDTIFMRVDEVLSQYGQTWGGIAILMQEWSQGVLSIEGLAALLASKDKDAQAKIVQRAQMLQLTQSIARMRLIDAKEKYQREVTPMSGVADVLNQFMMRLAAAANMPVSLLFGQVKGGLGDAGNTDLRFFYDRVKSMQDDRLVPPLQRLTQVQFRAKEGPTKGVEPKRWLVKPRALYQLNEMEQAELRNKQAMTDQIYANIGGVSPEEIAASRFGGSKYSTDTVLDLEGRQKLARAPRAAAPPALPPKPGGPGVPPAPGSTAPPLESPGDAPAAARTTGGPGPPDARQPSAEGAPRDDAAREYQRVPKGQAGGGEFGSEGGGAAKGTGEPKGESSSSAAPAAEVAKRLDPKLVANLPKEHTVEQHIEIAQRTLGAHREHFEAEKAKLQSIAPEGSKVFGRVKAVESAVEKVSRKPQYGTVATMQDLTGTTIEVSDPSKRDAAIKAVRANYKVVSEDDYNAKPTNLGYRAHHFIVEGEGGLQKEIQVHTPRQAAWKAWFHDSYKPISPEQKAWAADEGNSKAMTGYAKGLSDHFAALDAGKSSTRPVPPAAVASAPFGAPPSDAAAAGFRSPH